MSKALTALAKRAKKSGFGIVQSNAIRPVPRTPVDVKRPAEVQPSSTR